MNLHEYQGKQILASYGVRVQRGYVANNAEEAVAKAKQLTAETGNRMARNQSTDSRRWSRKRWRCEIG